MQNGFKAKTFANTFIYSKTDDNGRSTEQALIEFILKSSKDRTRLNKNSTAFKPILAAIKERQKTAVLFRVLMNPNVVLAISPTGKELPASFKVFCAQDVAATDKKKKIFIDVTGLIKEESGYFNCKDIDKLCAYLFGAAVMGTYYYDNPKITNNANIVKGSAECFVKMFCGVLDGLRVINYTENSTKIKYIAAVYYLYNLVQKDLNTAEQMAIAVAGIDAKTANAYRFYYEEEHLENINTLINHLTQTFNMKGLTTDVYINKWLNMYGNGTMYGTELMPSFLIIMTNVYSGSYINRANTIEAMCGRTMVSLCETLLRVTGEYYDKGAVYSRVDGGDVDIYTEIGNRMSSQAKEVLHNAIKQSIKTAPHVDLDSIPDNEEDDDDDSKSDDND